MPGKSEDIGEGEKVGTEPRNPPGQYDHLQQQEGLRWEERKNFQRADSALLVSRNSALETGRDQAEKGPLGKALAWSVGLQGGVPGGWGEKIEETGRKEGECSGERVASVWRHESHSCIR